MAVGRIKSTELSAIAAAIRSKNGESTAYKPSEMAAAIAAIPGASTLGSKSISANGNYNPASDNLDGYSSVAVNVPNSYGQSDEGKVVSNGALVAQGSDTVTQNGTVDTTLISSLTVNVSGGGGALPTFQSFGQILCENGNVTIVASSMSYNIAPIVAGNNITVNVSVPFEVRLKFQADNSNAAYRMLSGHTGAWYDAPWAQLSSNASGNDLLFYFAFPTSSRSLIDLQVSANEITFSTSSVYTVVFGFDGSKIYASVTDGTTTVNKEQAASALYTSGPVIVFGTMTNTGSDNRCAVGVHYDLAHCYIKQNGVIVWGEGAS